MTALADSPSAQHGPSAYRGPGDAGPGPAAVPGPVLRRTGPGRSGTRRRTIRSWPLLVLAFPAAAEVWSGWVGIAQKTGFGLVSPLPGIWSSLHLDTTITLPVGVEATRPTRCAPGWPPSHWISHRTRRFAKWSAICSFALGMAGQVAYHLLDQAGESRAPWGITTLVSCLPVLVLAMGTALAHMLRDDAAAADSRDSRSGGPAGERSPGWSAEDQPADQPGQTGPGPRDQDHGPDQSPRGPASLRALPARQHRPAPPRIWFPVPRARRTCRRPHRPQASRSRETRVAAGTAQRRGQGVQREPERARPPAQRRTRERAGHRPVGSQGRAASQLLPGPWCSRSP